MNKIKNKKKGIMYSTNPDFEYEYENDYIETLQPKEQKLKICIDKHRSGKIAVIIKGFVGDDYDLNSLSRFLKTKCGVGGTAKNGEIIIQGNVREKVIEILKKEGYNYKKVGG